MKKLGLWMLAAILLCGSVVTFVACRGNSLEDIIGNVDNGSGNSDEVNKLLALVQNAETITITVNYASVPTDLTFKKENGSFVFQVPDGASMGDYNTSNVKLKIENEKELIFSVYSLYGENANAPFFAVIVDAEKKEYSRVNYNANYDFVSIKIDGQSVDITDACPKKNLVVGNEALFYVYYASGETWEDVAKRYSKAFGKDKTIVEETGDNSVYLKWNNYPTSSTGTSTYNLRYKNDGYALAKYNHIVGKKADGTTDYEGDDNPYTINAPVTTR